MPLKFVVRVYPGFVKGEKITGKGLEQALDGSLKRLQTDYIDLYQLHWPNRANPHFCRHWPQQVDYAAMDVAREREDPWKYSAPWVIVLKRVKFAIVVYQMIRRGVLMNIYACRVYDLPKVVSIQNEFSLIHLLDSPHLIETCVLNDVAYLPWSPLAGGALSGKYRNGALPANCRWTIEQRNGIFRDTSQSHEAIEALYEVATRHKLSLTQMSLAWVYTFKGVTSTIIGATSLQQLKEDIGAYQVLLSKEIMQEIDQVIRRYPVPF